jgi:cytochrome c553
MKRRSTLLLPLLTPFVVAWSITVDAQSCANGSAVYVRSNAATTGLSCSSSVCHGATASKNKIQNAARNPVRIDDALAGLPGGEVMTDLNLRANLPLSNTDVLDLAEWIYWAGTRGVCPPTNAPSLSVAPASWDFGSVNLGSTSTARTFVVTNFGSVAASGLALHNPDQAQWIVTNNTCSGTITASGGTCSLGIGFAPAAAGATGATLTISHAGGGAVVMALSGVGTSSAPPPPPPGDRGPRRILPRRVRALLHHLPGR